METDNRGIWSHYQGAGLAAFEAAKPRLDFLLRETASRLGGKAIKVLNVGCGDGYFEVRAHEEGFEVHSIDPDSAAIARLAGLGIAARVGEIGKLPYADGSLDAVIASEVMEHLSDEESREALREVARVLRPGGYFIGTVPHAEVLADNVVVCPDCTHRFHRWGHQRSLSLADVRAMLTGFTIEAVKCTAFVSLRGRGLRGFAKGAIRLALGKAGSPIASPNIWWAARK